MRPQGKLCIIGIPDKPVTFGAFGLIGGEKSIVGGQTGSVGDTAEMLAFSARHGIKPTIETFAMAEPSAPWSTPGPAGLDSVSS